MESFYQSRKIDGVIIFGSTERVNHIETTTPATGVTCDVYEFEEDSDKDLAIIEIQPGFWTPEQEVKEGIVTIEGNIRGDGALTITREDGSEEVYFTYGGENLFHVEVHVGDSMQWFAHYASEVPLRIYELCSPPWGPTRFRDKDELKPIY